MARARNIKPGFFTNEDLVELNFGTRLLFAGLWTLADREGRLEDRPKKIKIGVFPADNVDVDAMLQELHEAKFVVRYEVNGSRYVQIANWSKHQNPHHTEKPSEIPGIDGVVTVKSVDKDGGNPADSLIPDSLIPDSLDKPGKPAAPAEPPPPVPEKRESAPTIEGVPESLLKDWKKVRAAKRAGPISQTVIDALRREAAAACITVEQAVRTCVERGWQGFKAEWYSGASGTPAAPGSQQSGDGVGRRFV